MRRALPILLLVLALAVTPAAGQHILATTFVDVGGGQNRVQLVDIHPASGVATLLGAAATDAASATGISAHDPVDSRYFFLGTPSGGSLSLYVVDAQSGTFVRGTLSGGPFDSLQDLEYDPSGGVLYALLSVGGDGQKRMGSVDFEPPGVGTVTLLGSGPFTGGPIPFSGIAEIDPTLNRLYFVGGLLYGVDLTVPDVFDSGATGPALLGLEPDADSGVLYGLQASGSDRRLVLVSTAAADFGTITTTGPNLLGGSLSTSGLETSDSDANRYYFLGTPSIGPTAGQLSLWSVDTGTLTLASPQVALSGVTNQLGNLEYDPGAWIFSDGFESGNTAAWTLAVP